jgi:hypothetical protein
MVTLVTYKCTSVSDVLKEISGLIVLTRIMIFLLHTFNEWRFNKKMKKEANDDFREVFTYSNFKRTLAENQEVKQ